MNKTDLPGSVLLFLRFGATFAPFRLGVGNVAVSRRSTRHEEVAGGEGRGRGAILALRAAERRSEAKAGGIHLDDPWASAVCCDQLHRLVVRERLAPLPPLLSREVATEYRIQRAFVDVVLSLGWAATRHSEHLNLERVCHGLPTIPKK
jgi:hypothetical protein